MAPEGSHEPGPWPTWPRAARLPPGSWKSPPNPAPPVPAPAPHLPAPAAPGGPCGPRQPLEYQTPRVPRARARAHARTLPITDLLQRLNSGCRRRLGGRSARRALLLSSVAGKPRVAVPVAPAAVALGSREPRLWTSVATCCQGHRTPGPRPYQFWTCTSPSALRGSYGLSFSPRKPRLPTRPHASGRLLQTQASIHLGTRPLEGPRAQLAPTDVNRGRFPPTGFQAPQRQARPRGPGSRWPHRPGLPARSDSRAPRYRPTLKAPGSRLNKRQASPGGPSGPSHFAGASKQGSRPGIVLKGLGRSRYHPTGPGTWLVPVDPGCRTAHGILLKVSQIQTTLIL